MQTDVLERWQAQCGSFFDGLSLVAVEEIYWPIHRYLLTANLRQTTGLDALEEGLLRLVEAGVSSVNELTQLLGCSRAYVETMGRYLKAGVTPYVNDVGETWSPTPATKAAIAAGERTILVPEDRDLLRDGLFGFWLSHGDAKFKMTENPNSATSPSRWLGTLVEAEVEEQELSDKCRLALSTFDTDVEVHSYDEVRSGGLAWAALRLLYFQSADQKVGRVLLLNPESEDRPLDDLSFQFEQQLRTGNIPLYFPDDLLRTGSSFWESLATPVTGFSARETTALIENDLAETRQELNTFKTKHDNSETAAEFSRRFADALRTAQQTNSGEALLAVFDALTELLRWLSFRGSLSAENCSHLDHLRRLRANGIIAPDQCDRLTDIARTVDLSIGSSSTSDSDRKHISDRLVALLNLMSSELGLVHRRSATQEGENKEVIRRYEETIAKRDAERQQLLDKIDAMPTSQLLECREHPPLLGQALREAKQTLILISPWVKMRVLRPLLPELDGLLARGCEVWIGYGMPKSKHHQNSSDADAIRALQERQQTGMLYLVEMVTHEKVLIVDDLLFVNSSFNWLSYTGGDGRRETGTVLRGRLSHIRDRFLTDMRKKMSTQQYSNAEPN